MNYSVNGQYSFKIINDTCFVIRGTYDFKTNLYENVIKDHISDIPKNIANVIDILEKKYVYDNKKNEHNFVTLEEIQLYVGL